MGHCHLYPLYSWQDILHTFAELELDSTTMFPPGTNVMSIRSTGEPVLAQVVGQSERGDASPYNGSPLNASYAEFFRLMLQFLCLQMCVYDGSAVPRGGGGASLGNRPWWGTVFPGVGKDKGGGRVLT